MIRAFLGNQTFTLFFIPFFVMAYLFLNLTSSYFQISDSIELGFWGSVEISKYAGNYLPWISGFLVLINSYLINYFFNSNGFYEKNSYIISLLYVILLSYYRTFYFLDGLLIAHTFVLLAFIQMYKMEYNTDGRSRSFNSGFFFGVAATFHPPMALILPFIWFMILRIRPFVMRETILSTMGLTTPLIYAFTSNLYYNQNINLNFIESTKSYTQKEMIFLSSIILFIFLVLTSWIGIRNKTLKSSIRFRKNTNILFIFLFFGMSLGLLDWIFFQQYEWFCYIVIPIALFLPFSYLNMEFKFIANMLFYITFGFSVIKFFI